jgi:uncharacterized OB-fold protein
MKPSDWTNGHEAIVYQACGACGKAQYFRRGFCAVCGSSELAEKRASGKGTVYATSVVTRAATAETAHTCPTISCWSMLPKVFA